MNREVVIRNCFKSWITKDSDSFRNSFANDINYIESWGPAYRGIEHVVAWFETWNSENVVLKWDVKEFFHTEDVCICEWYFECECGSNVDGFNGVSIIGFNDEDKITFVREFQSKTPNIYPFE